MQKKQKGYVDLCTNSCLAGSLTGWWEQDQAACLWKIVNEMACVNPLPGATSENVRAGPWGERPKTSGRDR